MEIVIQQCLGISMHCILWLGRMLISASWWHLGPVSESSFSENSDFVNSEMRETLGFPFQKER